MKSLKKHFLTHTREEKPFTCEVCNGKFTYAQALKKHLLIHTGENVKSCEVCSLLLLCTTSKGTFSPTQEKNDSYAKFVTRNSLACKLSKGTSSPTQETNHHSHVKFAKSRLLLCTTLKSTFSLVPGKKSCM